MTDEEKWLAVIKLALEFNATVISSASLLIASKEKRNDAQIKLAHKQFNKMADDYVKTLKNIVEGEVK